MGVQVPPFAPSIYIPYALPTQCSGYDAFRRRIVLRIVNLTNLPSRAAGHIQVVLLNKEDATANLYLRAYLPPGPSS